MNSLFGSGPAVTFNEPIELLKACHGKVTRFSQDLLALPDYVAKRGVNHVVIDAITQIRHYFNLGAKLHHQDEEVNLFPLLIKYAPDTQTQVQQLLRDHQQLDLAWQGVETCLLQLLAQPHTDLSPLAAFAQAYADHIEREEPLFDIALATIPEPLLANMGHLMADRRQQRP
ncbi:MAG: hemerythrin domain-containing protein [Neisseriaceae bacterium]|nr:hemerythrin domain-containing protein [Neisseriaceae bacterium]MBP6863452.1 hemerythrin domain-containing protein [Neisseriaceae bacterium]